MYLPSNSTQNLIKSSGFNSNQLTNKRIQLAKRTSVQITMNSNQFYQFYTQRSSWVVTVTNFTDSTHSKVPESCKLKMQQRIPALQMHMKYKIEY